MRHTVFALLLFAALTARAQSLSLRLHALTFFHDNEFASQLTKGYTLPGARLTPALVYDPLPQIHLELGATALLYHGANRYPNYAYHDIATWKGNQYQRGAHVLPWLRAEARFQHLTLTLGDIHGGRAHGLIEPLWNPETDLSQDPEAGFQLQLHRRHILLDTWLNWQSYIFDEDTHQEAFTVGTTARILPGDTARQLRFALPLQLLIQHRGGEQDTTSLGVQTLCNASLGLNVEYRTRRRLITSVEGQLNALACLQENGELWPFDTGFALHAEAAATLLHQLTARLGYVATPRQFIPLYGTPLYGTLSLRPDTYYTTFRSNHTAYLFLQYRRTIARDYTLGALFQLYQGLAAPLRDTNFSFGLTLELDPHILLKRW